MKADNGTFRSGIHLRDTSLSAQSLDLHHIEQMSDFLGQLPEAIDQLGGKGVNLRARLKGRQAPVKTEPELQVRDESLWDENRGTKRYGRAPLLGIDVCVTAALPSSTTVWLPPAPIAAIPDDADAGTVL